MEKSLVDDATVATTEVAIPHLQVVEGQVMATSLEIAKHFGKRHRDVMRAIRNLVSELPTEHERIFALMSQSIEVGQGGLRHEPMYQMNRDGFALLAMGFTGPRALQFKLNYIAAFNALEAKLRETYVAPLVSEQEFRNGISLKSKLTLRDQSHQTMRQLRVETDPAIRRNLYWQLRQINDTLGIPTESAEQLLRVDAPALQRDVVRDRARVQVDAC